MKRFVPALLFAALVSGAQASPFPPDADQPAMLPVQSTYADRHLQGDAANQIAITPADADQPAMVPARSTYAERFAQENRSIHSTVVTFPIDADQPAVLAARSTYADRFAQASGASAVAALSE